MPFFFWDDTMILLIPAVIFSLYAQMKVKSTYSKYSKVFPQRGITGKEVAEQIISRYTQGSVKIEAIEGELSDHYDPKSRTLRLSAENFQSSSIASLGVAAHEAGHAMQHYNSYAPLQIRNAIVPATNFASTLAFPLIIAGFFINPVLLDIGIVLFSGAVLFTLITLPVEFDASRRALKVLHEGGYLMENEMAGAGKVLNAAALTYVAAAASAVLNLIRLLLIRDSFGDD